MARISLAGVSHTYPGGIKAVNDLDLEVLDGELLVLLGPSGCGKSTTLRLIAGLESPARGVLRLRDREANRLPPHARDVAMLFQEEALYPHLSVRDNLGFSLQARRRGWLRWRETPVASAPEVRERVEQAARRLGLGNLLERRPAALSGGERQRVALGRLLVRGAGIWLLDEPFAHVDTRLRTELRRMLRALQREQAATAVYVTHDQIEAFALADRVAVMRDGRIEQVGTRQELYERPLNQFVAGFVGDPPMNFAIGEVVRQDGMARFVADGWSMRLDEQGKGLEAGRRLVAGLRPSVLRLVDTTNRQDESIRRLGMATVVGEEWHGEAAYTAIAWHASQHQEPAQWWWVKSPADLSVEMGSQVDIAVEPEPLWFDVGSGERV
jgi:multiple sugar transport system ATP-binding protein